MIPLDYAIRRVKAVQSTIKSIKECEFPYEHSCQALEKIDEIYSELFTYLEKVRGSSDPNIITVACAQSLIKLYE